MDKPLRRIVTGHDASGKAVISMDGPPPISHHRPETGVRLTEFWTTYGAPTPIEEPGDNTTRRSGVVLAPPEQGTIVRIVEFQPDKTWIHKFDAAAAHAAFADIGAGDAHVAMKAPPHPMMHRTRTVDYGIVLEGEIWLILDDSETCVKAGEIVVQRGTNHAWANRSDQVCRVAFVLIDGTWPQGEPHATR